MMISYNSDNNKSEEIHRKMPDIDIKKPRDLVPKFRESGNFGVAPSIDSATYEGKKYIKVNIGEKEGLLVPRVFDSELDSESKNIDKSMLSKMREGRDFPDYHNPKSEYRSQLNSVLLPKQQKYRLKEGPEESDSLMESEDSLQSMSKSIWTTTTIAN